MAIFTDVQSATRRVFLDNNLTEKKTTLIRAGSIDQIFAFNNILTGTYVNGVSDTNSICKNIYTKNETNLNSSKFTGKLSGTGFLGGLFGQDISQTDLFITNTQVTGTVEGAGIKGSLVCKSIKDSVEY